MKPYHELYQEGTLIRMISVEALEEFWSMFSINRRKHPGRGMRCVFGPSPVVPHNNRLERPRRFGELGSKLMIEIKRLRFPSAQVAQLIVRRPSK